MDTFVTKLGPTRAGERSRIWIEGKRLAVHGFTKGETFVKLWADNSLTLKVLHVVPKAQQPTIRSQIGTVSGKGEKPIIDICGTRVATTFTGTHVKVTYRNNVITIRGSNEDTRSL